MIDYGRSLFDGRKVYSGTFAKGEMTGWGSKKWPDGRFYKGPFQLGGIFLYLSFFTLLFEYVNKWKERMENGVV